MENLYNQLYWLAEDLKSYTDLSGDRFDIDYAQRRLWKMIPILKANDFPDIQKQYDELDGSLENAVHFDKSEFSEKVDQLYLLLEKRK